MVKLISESAQKLFFMHGIKSIAMDDIAREAGISKQNIYKVFSDKHALVDSVVEDLILQHTSEILRAQASSRDAVDEALNGTSLPFSCLASVNPNFFAHLRQLFPKSWKKASDHKNAVMIRAIIANLERGIKEENFEKELDLALITNIRMQQVLTALNPTKFHPNETSPSVLMKKLSAFYLQAITTTNGKKLLNKYVNEKDKS